MSLETIKRMRCDECGATGPEVTGAELPMEAAIAEGWVFERGKPDICPECVRSRALLSAPDGLADDGFLCRWR